MISFNIIDRELAPDLDLESEAELDQNVSGIYREKLSHLMDKAPSDASLSTKILKIKKGYEGVIEIISSRGKFLATSIHRDPEQLVIDLFEQIYGQIRDWRNERLLLLN